MPSEREILLRGFSEEEREEFLKIAKEEKFPLHEIILREGDYGSHMYIIGEGETSVWLKGAKLAELGKGSVIGISVIVEPQSRIASVRAESSVRLLRFDREDVMNFFRSKPPRLFQLFFVNAFKILLNTLKRCNQRIVYLDNLLKEQLGV